MLYRGFAAAAASAVVTNVLTYPLCLSFDQLITMQASSCGLGHLQTVWL